MICFKFGRRIECIEILHVAVQRIADPGEEGSGKPGRFIDGGLRKGVTLEITLGRSYRSLGKWDSARNVLESALETARAEFGSTERRTLQIRRDLGDALMLVARAELEAGRTTASRSAERAAEMFEVTGRSEMVPHAAALSMYARLRAAGEEHADGVRRVPPLPRLAVGGPEPLEERARLGDRRAHRCQCERGPDRSAGSRL